MYKTAECVTFCHPDKVCDQIADAILDECLKTDPFTRSAVEVLGGHGKIFISGELTTDANVNFVEIAKRVYGECGYDDDIEVLVHIAKQSNEIKKGVDSDGAGDQGIMIGYATNETEEFLPKEFVVARELTRIMGRRDGKAQVTLAQDGSLVNVVTSVSNRNEEISNTLFTYLQKTFPNQNKEEIKSLWYDNPNGEWNMSGFDADAGLTGRKIVVDAYGPRVPVGGGAFSGKDATKVDRSGAYMARYIAVDLLKKMKAKEVRVEMSYAIGVSKPTSAYAIVDGQEIALSDYDLRPKSIIEFLDLRKPIFLNTARRGHFGNSYPWD